MHALSVPSTRPAPLRLTARKVSRARVLLGRKPVLCAELEALRNAAARALSASLSTEIQLTPRMADSPTVASRALGHSAVLCAVALEGPGTEAFLEVDPRLVATLAALRTGGSGPDVPVLAATPFERALLGELLLGVLAASREVGAPEARWRPRLVEVGVTRADALRRLGSGPSTLVEIDLESPAFRARTVLHVPELALRAVALSTPDSRPGPGPVTSEVRIYFSPRIACGAVWRHMLTSLTGAAVVLPRTRFVDDQLQGPLALVRSGVVLRGTLGADGLRHDVVEVHPSSQEVTHVDPALSELPVELEVELARVPLSLAELGALRPGAVLPLRVNAGDPVFLRAGDRRIGRAELVEVEGEVAARVLELVP